MLLLLLRTPQRYFWDGVVDAVPISVSPDSGWESTTGFNRMRFTLSKGNTEAIETNDIVGTGTDPNDVMLYQLVAGPFVAQTIGGTFKLATLAREFNAGVNARAQTIVKTFDLSGSVLHTLLAMDTGALASEFSSVGVVSARFPKAYATGGVAISQVETVPFYIVVEVGARVHSTDTANNVRVTFRDLAAEVDASETEGTGGLARGWLELTQSLVQYGSGTFTANAVITTTPTATVTADAVIKSTTTYTGSIVLLGDFVLGSDSLITYPAATVDAIVKKTSSASFTADAVIQAAFTVDAAIASPTALDRFGRVETGTLGTADQGGAWAFTGSSTDPGVDGDVATLGQGTSGFRARLPSTHIQDGIFQVQVRFSSLAGGSTRRAELHLRGSESGTYLAFSVIFVGTGSTWAFTVGTGASPDQGSVDVTSRFLTYNPSDWINILVRFNGSAFNAVAWSDAEQQPDWDFSDTVSGGLIRKGYVGLGSTFAGANEVFFDNLVARALTEFTADAEIAAGAAIVTGSFTGDAIVKKTQTNTHTANAVLKATASASFTANAIILRPATATLTADAVIRRTQTGTFAEDAVVLRTQVGSFTANAVISRTQAGSYTADAVIRKTSTATATADAVLYRAQTGSFTADALLLRTTTATPTADAVLLKTQVATFTASAWIQGSGVSGVTADAVLFKNITGSATADAMVSIVRTGSFTADARLLAIQTATFTANAVIKATITGSFTANAWIFAQGVTVVTADAVLLKSIGAQFTANALISRTETGSFTANAWIRRTQTGSFTLDAVVKAAVSGSYTLNAITRAERLASVTGDAILLVPRSQSATANAVILAGRTGVLTANGVLFAGRTGSFTLDAYTLTAGLGLFTIDASIVGAGAGTFTASAVIQATVASGFTVDAVVDYAVLPPIGAITTIAMIEAETTIQMIEAETAVTEVIEYQDA